MPSSMIGSETMSRNASAAARGSSPGSCSAAEEPQAVIDALVAGNGPERLGSSAPVQPGQLLGRVNPLFIVGALVTGDGPEGPGAGSGVESGQLLGCFHVLVVVFVDGDVSFLCEVCSGIRDGQPGWSGARRSGRAGLSPWALGLFRHVRPAIEPS